MGKPKKKITDWKTTLAGVLGGALTGAVGIMQLTNGNIDNKQGWMLLAAAAAQGALGYFSKDK